MRWVRNRLAGQASDRGVALISAVAVAAIGAMFIVVVVGSVISAARDSGTDRARTSEVHTAEGAVDAAYAALETTTPCRLPATGNYDSGDAPVTTSVHADVTYYDGSGAALPCASGVVTGTPASAVITAQSTTSGQTVKRTIQSKVNLTPVAANGRGAAVFSATGVSPTNYFTLRSLDPNSTADLWVDSGDYRCSMFGTVSGSVVVVNGNATLDNGCAVGGDLYTSGTFTINSEDTTLLRVGGDMIARGNATIAGASRFGGNVLIHGTLTHWGSPVQAAGSLRTGVALSELPTYVRKGLPEVIYKPSDFTGFTVQSYPAWVAQNAAAHGAASSATTRDTSNAQCDIEGGTGGKGVGGAMDGPTTPAIFDIRACGTLQWGPNITVNLHSDLVLYVPKFIGTNSLTVQSADGQPHRFWILSPDPDGVQNGTAVCGTRNGYTSGDIQLSANSYFRRPISTFIYTPCSAQISNYVDLTGQIYAGSAALQNNLTVTYDPIGIPGVDLESSTPVASNGYRVDIVYKREIHNS